MHTTTPSRWSLVAASLAAMVALAACGGGASSDNSTSDATAGATGSTGTPGTTPTPQPTQADRIAVGDKLFHDVSLSASGRLACASCHAPDRGHADPQGVFLPIGGAALDQQGLRSSPTLRYLDTDPAFGFDANGQPHGGFFWDGRANSRAAQAAGPLLGSAEMANADESAVATKVQALPYYSDLAFAFNLPAQANTDAVFQATVQALAAYQQGDAEFHPFSSKFDAVQAGQASFTAEEARGLQAFNDPRRGNCASCHSSAPPPGGTHALFTNFAYFALGVPRNHSTRTDGDPSFFDLGLCGPNRSDLVATRPDLCGEFKVPTLRNVELTAPYFHNARFSTLNEVVSFYATRDTNPERWYPTVDGQVQRFDDLPTTYKANVTMRPPFGRQPGQTPPLSSQDVSDIVAFLRTLTDGWQAP